MGIFAVLPSLDRFPITTYHRAHIFCATGTTFDLKNPNAGIQHLIEEMNGLQVLGRHDILIFDIKLQVRRLILDGIAAPTYLYAGTSVGTEAVVIQAQVTFAAHRHA